MDHKKVDKAHPALFIGIDWADKKHDVCSIDAQGHANVEQIENTPEAIDAWIGEKLAQTDGRPIAIMLEKTRSALVYALLGHDNIQLYPINPKQLANYRESFSNGKCKADVPDARLLARMLRERHHILTAWEPDDEQTRLIARLCENRRKVVHEHTRLLQQLIELLKSHNPGILALSGDKTITPLMLTILKRWPDPRQLKRADRRWLCRVLKEHGLHNAEKQTELIQLLRNAKLVCNDRAVLEPAAVMVKSLVQQIEMLQKTIEQLAELIAKEMQTHPDAFLFEQLPGAGPVMAPRLLAAFGSQRDRYKNADELAVLSGIAPVTKQSGKKRVVHRRFACPKFLRQTFHEFADHARRWCPWSRAYYNWLRSRGMKHHATLRKLAFRWIRILFVIWRTRTPYDPGRYLAAIKAKNPAIHSFLAVTAT